MKDSTLFVSEKLNGLYNKFTSLKIRYEFSESLSTHLIEILPLECFESNQDYILLEMEIENEFERLYGSKEDILFISSNSLNEVKNAQFSIGY